jgi:hypothetical protein
MFSDLAYPYNKKLPTGTYHTFCRNVYSQNGEDGILEQIFSELEIQKGYFCEFGAGDGMMASNSLSLIKNNWRGVLIECDSKSFSALKNNIQQSDVTLLNVAVDYNVNSPNSLDNLLQSTNTPHDFDFLSIDIDLDDIFIWEGFKNFRPKVVLIEANSYRDPICIETPKQRAYERTNDILATWYPDRIQVGSSFMSLIKLGLTKGYTPLSFTGNICFIANEYLPKLKVFPYRKSDDPYDHIGLYTNLCMWGNEWFTCTGLTLNTAIRNYYLKHKSTEWQKEWVFDNMNTLGDAVWDFNSE